MITSLRTAPKGAIELGTIEVRGRSIPVVSRARLRMTDKQLDRLPGILAEIVRLNREIERPVFPFEEIRPTLSRRDRLRAEAEKIWGPKVSE